MPKILIPASSPEDWKRFLAEPDKHWRQGYSARSLAYCWQEADSILPDILAVLGQVLSLQGLKTILAIPEHQVLLPGGSRPSQTDVCGAQRDGERAGFHRRRRKGVRAVRTDGGRVVLRGFRWQGGAPPVLVV